MRSKTRLSELAETLRSLGALDPEGWAQSEISEDIPQLARFLFLRQAWRNVLPEADNSWIPREIEAAKAHPDAPGAGAGQSLMRLLASGASPSDLTELARVMQWQLLFSLCYLLEDPGDIEPQGAQVSWALFELDANDRPARHIGGLHESVLETDPTGREMRPRPAA
jgi:hypothetical protein